MKMLALVTDAFGGKGGIAQYNRDFLTAASSVFDRVDILPLGEVFEQESLPTGLVQHRPIGNRLTYSARAMRFASRRRYDICFCAHPFLAPLAWMAARLRHSRLLVQAHGIDAWNGFSGPRIRALEKADHFLAVSRHTRDALLEHLALDPGAVSVLPNTFDAQFFTPDAAAGRNVRSELQLVGRKLILTVGRMSASEAYKGHDRVIEVMPALLAKHPDLVYVVLGDGDDRNRLEVLARRHGVDASVRFVGELDRATMRDVYRAADVFVMPSTDEGFGIVFLEAMACGTPAVGLSEKGARDALVDGVLGIATRPDDLSATILSALDDPPLEGEALAQAVRERFGRETFERQVGTFFNQLMQSPAGRSRSGTV